MRLLCLLDVGAVVVGTVVSTTVVNDAAITMVVSREVTVCNMLQHDFENGDTDATLRRKHGKEGNVYCL